MDAVVHFEVAADNPERAIKFYEDVFGWRFDKWEGGNMDYWMVHSKEDGHDGINGGLFKRREPLATGGENAFVCSLDVKNAEEAIKKVKDHGGKAEGEIMDVAGAGRMAYCTDTEGNRFGIWEATKKE